MSNTVSCTVNAYLPPHSHLGVKDLTTAAAIPQLAYGKPPKANEHDIWKEMGYTFVGTARIAFNPLDESRLISEKIKALKGEVESIKANSTAKITSLEEQINQLLAIENQGAVV